MGDVEHPRAASEQLIATIGQRLTAIESAVAAGTYQAGGWQKLVAEIRGLPQADRSAVSSDVSHVSRVLHDRKPRHKIGFVAALLLESWAAIIGGLLLATGIADGSESAAIIGMLLWVSAFEPLVKISVGTMFGVAYEYAYLYGGVEPRFKMSYGTYLAAAPLARSLLHVSGMIGSPLAALMAALLTAPALPTAHVISWIVFWLTVAVNLVALVAAMMGISRIGGVRLPAGSPTSALIELRSWIGK